MNIAILDYSASEVRLIKNCPDSWEEEQIEEYIYGEDGLDLSESKAVHTTCAVMRSVSSRKNTSHKSGASWLRTINQIIKDYEEILRISHRTFEQGSQR